MKPSRKWFSEGSEMKATWIVAFTGIITVVVLGLQTSILSTQAKLINKQTIISKNQTQLLSNQIESSIKPFVDIQITSDNKGKDSLIIINKGIFPVCNIRINAIYFADISGHGWYVTMPYGGLKYDSIEPSQHLAINLVALYWPKDPPMAQTFIPKIKIEFLNVLVSFNREVDGQNYLCILPGLLTRTNNGIERMEDEGAISGPLSKMCNYGLELTYEYLKRRPLPKDYVLYNSNYILGYQPTGCLGNINWVN